VGQLERIKVSRGEKMLRKILIILAVASIGVFCLNGCKKRAGESESGEVVVKSMAEYEAEAKKEITPENMDAELDKLEKSVDRDIAQGQ